MRSLHVIGRTHGTPHVYFYRRLRTASGRRGQRSTSTSKATTSCRSCGTAGCICTGHVHRDDPDADEAGAGGQRRSQQVLGDQVRMESVQKREVAAEAALHHVARASEVPVRQPPAGSEELLVQEPDSAWTRWGPVVPRMLRAEGDGSAGGHTDDARSRTTSNALSSSTGTKTSSATAAVSDGWCAFQVDRAFRRLQDLARIKVNVYKADGTLLSPQLLLSDKGETIVPATGKTFHGHRGHHCDLVSDAFMSYSSQREMGMAGHSRRTRRHGRLPCPGRSRSRNQGIRRSQGRGQADAPHR